LNRFPKTRKQFSAAPSPVRVVLPNKRHGQLDKLGFPKRPTSALRPGTPGWVPVFIKTRIGRRFSHSTSQQFPFGIFLIAAQANKSADATVPRLNS
jgi:hypothetical protein